MLKLLRLSLVLFALTFNGRAQVEEIAPPDYIRTIQFTGLTEQNQLPIIQLGQPVQLSFDDINGNEADYYYVITHHDFDWTPSDLSKGEYMNGLDDVRIETYDNSLLTLQIFSHYYVTIPNRETRAITRSGNYLLSIYNDDRELMFSRKFMVVERIAGVEVSIKRARELKLIEEKQVVQFTVKSNNVLLVNPKQTVKTIVIKNNNLKNTITDLKPQYTLGNALIYRYDRRAAFGGGNEFLFFDNKNMRSPVNKVRYVDRNELYENYLHTDITRKDRPYTYNPDINGNFVVNNIDSQRNVDLEAEYVWMHFNLQYFDDLGDKEIHLFGNFNNWVTDESTKLHYDPKSDTYRNVSLFKQGFYNYKYVLVDPDGNVDEGGIGGDFWQTENNYTVIVYFRDLGARYDRIIGYGRANSVDINNY